MFSSKYQTVLPSPKHIFCLICVAGYELVSYDRAKMSDDIKKRFEFPNAVIQSQVILF